MGTSIRSYSASTDNDGDAGACEWSLRAVLLPFGFALRY
jgi:hypothetical protein